jgi:hypothetical protein
MNVWPKTIYQCHACGWLGNKTLGSVCPDCRTPHPHGLKVVPQAWLPWTAEQLEKVQTILKDDET